MMKKLQLHGEGVVIKVMMCRRGDGSSRVEGGPRGVVVCQASFGRRGDCARHQGDVAAVD